MKATRIAYSKGLNKGKYQELKEQATKLGQVRSEIWQRYGSLAGVGLYRARLGFEVLWCAKAPGLNDRKSSHISNIGRLTIVQPRELSRSTKHQILAARGIRHLQNLPFKLASVMS